MLEILLHFNLDASYKQSKFSEILLKKSLKFVLNNRNSIIVFIFNLVLLFIEINFILKKQSCTKDVLIAYSTHYIKMILILSIKIVALYL